MIDSYYLERLKENRITRSSRSRSNTYYSYSNTSFNPVPYDINHIDEEINIFDKLDMEKDWDE